MGELRRELIPDALAYCDRAGLPLIPPKGKWRGTRCDLCGASKALRINTESNGWCCMACLTKGGDMLALHMRLLNLDFVSAARDLGAYVDDDTPHRAPVEATTLSARDAMAVIALKLYVITGVISGIRRGVIPSDADWEQFLVAAGHIIWLESEYAP